MKLYYITIIHIILYLGRKYNKLGILSPWWNNQSIERFTDRTTCMINQYKKYTVNGENVSDVLTLMVLSIRKKYLSFCEMYLSLKIRL